MQHTGAYTQHIIIIRHNEHSIIVTNTQWSPAKFTLMANGIRTMLSREFTKIQGNKFHLASKMSPWLDSRLWKKIF